MNAGVVEEVVPVLLLRALGRVDDDARRNGLEGQSIVDAHRQLTFFAGADVVGDVGLERKVAPGMVGHLGIVDPDGDGVGGGLEVEADPMLRAVDSEVLLRGLPEMAEAIDP